MNEEMTKSEEQHLSLQKALQQCELVQNMIDISISSLEGLRTKCATSNDLTQKEIRTLEVSAANLCRASSSESIRRAVIVCWFLFRPRCIFPYILLIYDKAAFLLLVLPLHKRAEVSAKARRDPCCVQGHKSGDYGAAVGCCRLAHSAGGDGRRWLFSIRVRPIRPVRVYSPSPSPQLAHLSPHRCYARRADYWNRGKIAV